MAYKRITKQQSVQTEILDVELKEKTVELVNKVVGLNLKEATLLAESFKKTVRITREDNNYFIGSPEYLPTRLNLEIEKGIVVRAAIG